ncbi:hypothetical protein Tco_0931199 [Tanacetum coccineum]
MSEVNDRLVSGTISDFKDITRSIEHVCNEVLAIYHVSYDYAKKRNDIAKYGYACKVVASAIVAYSQKIHYFLNDEGNVNETPYESSDEYYSSDGVEELDYVDFHTEGKENVVIKNLTTQDPFLNKLFSNHGSFRGLIDEPVHVDQEPIDDPDDASIDPLFKVKKVFPTLSMSHQSHGLKCNLS